MKDNPSPPVAITPAKIKNLKALPRGDAIFLSWGIPQKNTDGSNLLDLQGFKILRSEINFEKMCLECPKKFLLLYDIDYKTYLMANPQATRIEYSDRELHYKNVYSYRVVSYTAHNQLSPKSNGQDIFWDVPSLPPRNLEAALQEKTVTLTWQEPAALKDGTPLEGMAGYNLYRKMPGETYPLSPINEKVITTLACRDKGIELDKDYLYTLRAVRKVRETLLESEGCEEVSITTTDRIPPGVPTGLIAIPFKEGITLKWDENEEPDLMGYNLYRKAEGESDFKRLNDALLRRATYLDRLVENRAYYTYTVTAVDDATQPNESALSEGVVIQYRY